MTFWSERYRTHPLWTTVAEARASISGVSISIEDHSGNEVLAYAGQVVELLERRRHETDSLEVAPASLDATNNAAAALVQGLEYVKSGMWSMSQAVDPTDSVMNSLAAWPPLKPARYLSGIQAATDAFAGKVEDALGAITGKLSNSDARLDELAAGEDTLKSQMDEQRTRIAEAVAEFKTDSNSQVNDLLAAQKQQIADERDSWVQSQTEYGNRADALIESLRGHEKTARSTVHATTALVVATDYGQYARNKTVAAWICDIAAAVVGGAGVTAILIHLYTLDGSADAEAGVSVTRLAASIGTLGIAALLGRRGAQHHREARAAKRTDLALRRVMPFIVDLPKDEQREIVLDFTERVFIRGDLDGNDNTTDVTLRQRIKQLREARSKASGASGNDET